MNRFQKKRKEVIPKPNIWTKKDTKRTIWISLLVLTLVCVPFFGGLDLFSNKDIKEYTGSTEGVVINIKDNKANSQGFKGGNIVIVTYTIRYSYRIASKEYIGNSTYFYKGEYIRFHDKLYSGKKLRIGYKINQPEESIILID